MLFPDFSLNIMLVKGYRKQTLDLPYLIMLDKRIQLRSNLIDKLKLSSSFYFLFQHHLQTIKFASTKNENKDLTVDTVWHCRSQVKIYQNSIIYYIDFL